MAKGRQYDEKKDNKTPYCFFYRISSFRVQFAKTRIRSGYRR